MVRRGVDTAAARVDRRCCHDRLTLVMGRLERISQNDTDKRVQKDRVPAMRADCSCEARPITKVGTSSTLSGPPREVLRNV
eukprot:CAMPEP_0170628996 /NCGR_PEP_ID=MMETSP0224-20130122/33051_1 /TAXON_ID=285029 /ORGANISM="Togula jolla, Strain CCCM 725" /LENGTH=80 /DNA_ID=CAMNT_0010956597 /DNA_START=1 /DNA_END=239 /DNA_ORIENTATION=+